MFSKDYIVEGGPEKRREEKRGEREGEGGHTRERKKESKRDPINNNTCI